MYICDRMLNRQRVKILIMVKIAKIHKCNKALAGGRNKKVRLKSNDSH